MFDGSDLKLEGCVCIGMHAEDLSCVCGRQALYVADAAVQVSVRWWRCISPVRGEAEPRQQHRWAVTPPQKVSQQYSVIVICDSTTVVDLACHVLQCLPRNSVLHVNQQTLHGSARNRSTSHLSCMSSKEGNVVMQPKT